MRNIVLSMFVIAISSVPQTYHLSLLVTTINLKSSLVGNELDQKFALVED